MKSCSDSGVIVHVNLNDFTTSGVDSLDLTTVDTMLTGWTGGFTDGSYGYLCPNQHASGTGNSGLVARFALNDCGTNPCTAMTTSGVTTLDLTTVDASLKGYTGGQPHYPPHI